MRLLERKFGEAPEELEVRVDAAGFDELRVWSERVLDAKSLDEVFEKRTLERGSATSR